MTAEAGARRRLFVPQVIQTSGMDCGPASLKALLAGFGIAVSYARLREACQTDVDGTSIDIIEALASRLGLAAGQYIVPVEHLLLAEADVLPAMVVTRQPNGLTHFVVVWRTHGGLVQLMDPARGRLWGTRRRFLRDVFVHRFPVEEALARAWVTAPGFTEPLRRRLVDLGGRGEAVDETAAQGDEAWLSVAALDAAVRLVARLGVGRGEAGRLAERLAGEAARRGRAGARELIPPAYWSVGERPDGGVELVGAVLVHVAGPAEEGEAEADAEADAEAMAPGLGSPELVAAVSGREPAPLGALLRAALAESRPAVVLLPPALLLAGAALAVEATVSRGLLAATPGDGALTAAAAFLAVTLALNLAVAAVQLRLGRWVDVHLRVRLLQKLPRLGNHYFHSRLTSDLAYRAHELRSLRQLPALAGEGLRTVGELIFATAGLAWLLPGSTTPLLLAALALLALPLALLPWLKEQELRRETHTSALARFYLDSLLGLTPIRTHRAEQPIRVEYEGLLGQWAAATRDLYRAHLAGTGVGMIAGAAFAVWTVARFAADGGGAGTLLAAFWAFRLPLLAQELVALARLWPVLHNRLARLFEVLDGPEEDALHGGRGEAPGASGPDGGAGVAIALRGVTVQAGGHRLLTDVDLQLRPGEHVAIVGPSGSGKSTLVGLLLGWHRVAGGELRVDGAPLAAGRLRALRRATAWVDPAVRLWNRPLADNLRYGNGGPPDAAVAAAIDAATLGEVLARLPGGTQGTLGEGGGLLSGGEGQRVRLARALLRPGVRLVVLDEPFRGLDAEQRRALLAVARRRWADATLLFVSHDIDTALEFERVLVVEGGRLVEDAAPAALLARPDSRLAALKAAADAAQREVWDNPVWRRWRMADGVLRAPEPEGP